MTTCRNSRSHGVADRLSGVLATLALPALLGSCGGGVGEAALVIPYITFSFVGLVPVAGKLEVASVSLESSDNAQGKSSGGITTRISIGNTSATASGTYTGNTMQLTSTDAAAPLAPAYGGQFVEADTIVLTPTSGIQPVITVVRADNSFRPVLQGTRWTGTDAGTGQAWKVRFPADPNADDTDSTVILAGDETVGATAGSVSGYAAMRRIEIDVVRNGRAVRLSGRMGPAGQTPPPSQSEQARPQSITFSDGSTLARE